MNSEFTYKLKSSFEYHTDGGTAVCEELVLSAPSYNTRKSCQIIKQYFCKAGAEEESRLIKQIHSMGKDLKDVIEDEKSKKKESEDSDSPNMDDESNRQKYGKDLIKSLFANSTEKDIATTMDEIGKLMTSGVCLVNGDKKLDHAIMQKITISDIYDMYGEYIGYFLVPSG